MLVSMYYGNCESEVLFPDLAMVRSHITLSFVSTMPAIAKCETNPEVVWGPPNDTIVSGEFRLYFARLEAPHPLGLHLFGGPWDAIFLTPPAGGSISVLSFPWCIFGSRFPNS